MPTRHALTAEHGARFTTYAVLEQANGTPFDLTGHTVTFEVTTRAATPVVLATHPAELDPDEPGWIAVEIPDTSTWPLGRVSYRLLLEPTRDVLLHGPLTVRTPGDV